MLPTYVLAFGATALGYEAAFLNTPPPAVVACAEQMQEHVNQWLRYLTVQGKSPITLSAYRRDVESFVTYARGMGAKSLRDVGPNMVSDWLASFLIEAGRGHATVRRKNAALRNFLTWCRARGLGDKLDCAPPIRKKPPRVSTPPTPEEIARMVEKCPAHTLLGKRNRALILTIWSTGCRRQEIIDMNLRDVRLERAADGTVRGEVKVRGKGSKERVVFLTPQTVKAIERYLPTRRPHDGDFHESALWLSRDGMRIDMRTVSWVVRRAAKSAGLPARVTTHTLRHAFASHLLRAGANLYMLKEMLGHSSIATTQIYLHMEPTEARDAHARMHPSNVAAKEPQGPIEGS